MRGDRLGLSHITEVQDGAGHAGISRKIVMAGIGSGSVTLTWLTYVSGLSVMQAVSR